MATSMMWQQHPTNGDYDVAATSDQWQQHPTNGDYDVATTSDQWRQQHPTNGDHDVAANIRPMAAMISYNIDMTPNKPAELHGKALARRLRGGLRCRGLQLLGKIFSISLFCSRRTGAQLEARRNKRHVGSAALEDIGPNIQQDKWVWCGCG